MIARVIRRPEMDDQPAPPPPETAQQRKVRQNRESRKRWYARQCEDRRKGKGTVTKMVRVPVNVTATIPWLVETGRLSLEDADDLSQVGLAIATYLNEQIAKKQSVMH